MPYKKRLRIGICCYPSHGGSGVVATELGKKLAERGHEIHIISYDKPFRMNGFISNMHFHDIEVPSYPVFHHPPYIMALSNKVYEIAQRESLDIVHAHYAVPHSLAAYLAKEMSGGAFKTVTTLHGTDVTIMGEDPALIDISKFSILKSDAVTAVSDDLRSSAEALIGSGKTIDMIHNFVDTAVYSRRDGSSVRSCLGIPDYEKVVVHISNFRKVKRIPDVISVFQGISASVPARLLLVGDGPEERMAYDMAKSMGILDRVHFLGKRESVESILSSADLFLLPSEKESFGLSALEAMSCGVPVIAANVGGIPEVVLDGECGLLSKTGDVAKMVSDSLKILSDKLTHERMSHSARKRAVEEFDSDMIVSRYERLYNELLETR